MQLKTRNHKILMLKVSSKLDALNQKLYSALQGSSVSHRVSSFTESIVKLNSHVSLAVFMMHHLPSIFSHWFKLKNDDKKTSKKWVLI